MSNADPILQQIVQRAAAGDASAFEQLCFIHHRDLHALACGMIPSDLRTLIDPEDVLQDAYYEAFRSRGNAMLENASAAYGWLAAIVRFQALGMIRAQRTLKRSGGADTTTGIIAMLDEVAQHRRTPSASAARHEAVRAVESAVDALPSEYREAIVLRYFDGHPFREVAQRMRRSEGSAMMLCNRAVKLLREQLGPETSFF
ncbi:MAG TPA: RNA polymerase sigma factor [Tepidisphaeraceae bacterium]|jgi:RNA polymerase sigma-70 factor (ECF subfamily)|nr:RNA polymerase sigma factor [Tepidisphaeraceae bacterium]